MFIYLKTREKNLLYRCLSLLIVGVLSFSLVLSPSASYAQSIITPTALNLPAPGTIVPITPKFDPAIIKGITLYPDNPLEFDFIINPGDNKLQGEAFEQESTKLVKYFLAALTVPEEEMWVNLSPYEKDRIVPDAFGQTEMGRDLLAQDYLLKQLTASLMNPEDDLGEKFWTRIYSKAQELFGTTEVPLNTFNKVWIVPQRAVVYQHENSAFVVDSYLKVMLEKDYVALNGHKDNKSAEVAPVTEIQSEIIREILLPEIEREVNEGATFANLRQIYHSMILATWYKQNLKGSFLEQIYVNKHKTEGIDIQDPAINEKIYDQYVEAFKVGVYNYIREDYNPYTQEIIPRKYFSGGVNAAAVAPIVANSPITDANLGEQPFPLQRRVADLADPNDRGVHFKLQGVSGGSRISLLPGRSRSSQTQFAAASPAEEVETSKEAPRSNAAIRWAEVMGYAIAMPFHSALITGLTFHASKGSIPFTEVLFEILLSFGITLVAGWSQISLHEMDHLNKGVEVRSLQDKDLETELRALKEKNLYHRAKRQVGNFLGIPLGLVRGIKREGLSYKPQISYNLYSEAWGVRGDRIRMRVTLPIAIGLFIAAGITGYIGIFIAGQVFFAFSVASLFSYKVNDPGQLTMLDERLKNEKDQALALKQKEKEAAVGDSGDAAKTGATGATSGGEKSQDLAERDKNWGGRLDDLRRIYKETGDAIETVRAQAGLLYERYRGRRAWEVVLRMPYQIMNVFNGGAHADKRFKANTISLQEGMYNPRGAKDGNEAQEWGDRLAQALQDEVEESDGIYLGLADEGGMAGMIEGSSHPMDRDDVLGRKMAQIPEVQMWRLMAQAIRRAGLRPWIDVTMAVDGAATQLEDMYREHIAENTGADAPVGQYYFYKAQAGEPIVLTGEEMIEMVRRMIVDYDVPFTSFEDIVSERDLKAQEKVNHTFKGLARVVVDDAAVTNSKNVERIVENSEGDTLLVKPNQIGDRLGLWEALVTAAGKRLRRIFSHRSQSPIDGMEPQEALGNDAEGMKVGGAKTNTRVLKRQAATDEIIEFQERVARLEAEGEVEMTAAQAEADAVLSRLKRENLEVTQVEVLRGNVNTSLPTAKVRVHFGIPGSPENHSVYTAEALTPIGASDGLGEAVHVTDSVFSRQEIPEGTKFMHFFQRQENGSFRFDKKGATREKIEATGDIDLIALFERSLPFNGKNIEVALARFREKAAGLMVGMKYSDIVDWQKLEEVIQQRELETYREFEQQEREREYADEIPNSEKLPELSDEEVILRKAYLGMQNLLASSFARYRLSAQLQGLRPWELSRLIYREGLAKVVAANGGMDLIPESIRDEMTDKPGEELWETIEANLSLQELIDATQVVNDNRNAGTPFYQVVRDSLGISFKGRSAASPVTEESAASSPAHVVGSAEDAVGGIDLDAAMLKLQVEQEGNAKTRIKMNHFPIPDVNIGGLVPVIIHVAPINVQLLLGITEEEESTQEISYIQSDKFTNINRRFKLQDEENFSVIN